MQKTFWTSVLAAAATLLTHAARAECTSPGFNTSGIFCNNCVYEGSMAVRKDQACERPYRPGGSAPMTVLGNRVVQRAKHGIAGANGTTFAYMPEKGYTGPDDFTVEVAFHQRADSGKFRVHFTVNVQ